MQSPCFTPFWSPCFFVKPLHHTCDSFFCDEIPPSTWFPKHPLPNSSGKTEEVWTSTSKRLPILPINRVMQTDPLEKGILNSTLQMLPKPSSSSTGFDFQMHPISSSHTALIPDPKTKFFPSPCQSPLSAMPFPLSAGQCLLICQGPAPITPLLRCCIDLGPSKVQMKRFYFMEGILTEVWTVLTKKEV